MLEENLSRLIGTVYDAALDRTLWPSVLPEAAGFVGGSASLLFSKNTLNLTGAIHYDWRMNPDFKQSYFDTYIRYDPVTPAQFLFEVEEPYSTVDLIPYSEFLETRFYREWARPQGLIDHMGATLDKTTTSFAAFGVFRNDAEGPADDEMYRRMRLIVPHIRRAVAKELGISENTVRTHVRHLFGKTDVRRLVDLVTLVAGHSSPIKS